MRSHHQCRRRLQSLQRHGGDALARRCDARRHGAMDLRQGPVCASRVVGRTPADRRDAGRRIASPSPRTASCFSDGTATSRRARTSSSCRAIAPRCACSPSPIDRALRERSSSPATARWCWPIQTPIARIPRFRICSWKRSGSPDGIILASRRPRSASESRPWCAHVVATGPECVGKISFDTDRARFVGRGRSLRAARAR